jgi:endo-1,4-beta-xylanase
MKRKPRSFYWARYIWLFLPTLVLITASGLVEFTKPTDVTMDLHEWDKFPGATVTDSGVEILGIKRRIVNQDGSDGQPNPPVNVEGSHLAVAGNFQVSVSMAGAASAGAVVRLYGDVPGIYDEWRREPTSIQVTTTLSGLDLALWDGKSNAPSRTQHISANIPDPTTLRISKSGPQLLVALDGHQVGAMPDPGVFRSGQLWFGLDAAGSGSWTAASIRAYSAGWGSVREVPAPSLAASHSDPKALRNLAAGTPRIGTAVSLYSLQSDPRYRALAIRQFNSWTPENEMKAQFIHPQPNTYVFSEPDLLVDTALANGITVHGHALVFSEANPAWMQSAPISLRPTIMADHVRQIVSHYRGKVAEWDVVNEPLSDNSGDAGVPDLRDNIWHQAMGESYIDQAFASARSADQNAQLYLNEYGLEQDGDRWDTFLALLKRLQARGVPIDGVGFQAHIHETGDEVDSGTLKKHFQVLRDLGLKVRISELDVHGDDPAGQAQQYSSVLEACLASSNCTTWSTWGFTDLHGSTTTSTYPPEYGDDLLWTSTYRSKPALKSVQASLASTKK